MDGAERLLRRLLVDPSLQDILLLICRIVGDSLFRDLEQFAENHWLVLDGGMMQQGQPDIILNLPYLYRRWQFIKNGFKLLDLLLLLVYALLQS